MWGYSGGSLASGFAAELQPAYAPELKIAGVALGGTVPKISTVIASINKSIFTGLIPGGIIGLSREYPVVESILKTQIKEEKKEKFMKADNQCFGANILTYAFDDMYAYLKDPDILNLEYVTEILNYNSMGSHVPKIPVLIYKAKNDVISPWNETVAIFDRYCAGGADVEFRTDLTADHASNTITGAPQAMIWLDERMRGIPVEKGCSKETQLTGLLEPGALRVMSLTIIHALLDILGKPVGKQLAGKTGMERRRECKRSKLQPQAAKHATDQSRTPEPRTRPDAATSDPTRDVIPARVVHRGSHAATLRGAPCSAANCTAGERRELPHRGAIK
ncbi:lipase 2 [Coccidioides immitis RMSCC 3703]|uniref:Lipase 2 n=1 Tax=Coccidioides immitis RMSCC 3703 TaxID=454286 RepID=A0A0J8QQD4_COCIT|nr:lipase 2 [Coccidioides immitis RMSCC 3703]